MSHHIYQTRAFIIDGSDIGEANRLITLFTADLGFIYATVQGVRLMKSKLRPSIQDMSYSKVSLVRGKELWRMTDSEKLISLCDRRLNPALKKLFTEEFSFLKRMAQGESKHEELFNFLSKFCDFVLKNTAFSVKHVDSLDLLAKMNILHELGYGSDEGSLKEFSNGEGFVFTEDAIAAAEGKATELRSHISKALHSSHL
jgi:DNA repair protein RecO